MFYTKEDRQDVLNLIIKENKNDPRIISTIIVGSGSIGFTDAYSDIDLSIVVNDEQDLLSVYKDVAKRILDQFSIFKYSEVIDANRNLQLFLLDNFLEIDIGYVYLSKLKALKNRWLIAYDHSGIVDSIMKSTQPVEKISLEQIQKAYISQLDDIWYNIMHATYSLKRELLYRSIFEISEIRNATIALHGLLKNITTKRYRNIHHADKEFLTELNQSFSVKLDKDILFKTIKNLTNLFFKEACKLDQLLNVNYSEKLKNKMMDFLNSINERCTKAML